MTCITQKNRDELPEMEPLFRGVETVMGFVPNSMLTMAHWPELVPAFSQLGQTTELLGPGEIDMGLKQLIAFVSSNASGCRYCQAHTSHSATRRGVSAEKVSAAFEFESSEEFSDAERAALRVTLHGGTTPNGVEASHIAELAKHYSNKQNVEIVAVIAMFGFLNRWNDTLATTLEETSTSFATTHLSGWEAGKHA